MNTNADILRLLAALVEQSGEKVSEARVRFLAEYFASKHSPSDVCAALKRLLFRTRKFPTGAEIETEMGITQATPQDRAREAAAKICGAIRRYGYTNPDRAKAYIGEAGWRAVELLGGWESVCNVESEQQMNTMQAQLRDLIESSERSGSSEHNAMLDEGKPTVAGLLGGNPTQDTKKQLNPVAGEFAALADKLEKMPNE